MGATGKRRVGMTAAVIIAALAVCIAAALAWYVGNSRHGEERDLAKAVAAGFVEKRARVEVSLAGEATGSMIETVVNYAEGPDNGPALVLVHGQGMQWEDYARVLPDLAQRYHVFAVDCFGHGESSHDPALYSCEAIGRAFKSFAAQKIGACYLVSGHSSGGIIAAWLAANDAEQVTARGDESPCGWRPCGPSGAPTLRKRSPPSIRWRRSTRAPRAAPPRTAREPVRCRR